MSTPKPIELFISYSREDERLFQKLEKHLVPLERHGLISVWHDRRIEAGNEWTRQLDEHIERARAVLLLVSPAFLASAYCYDIELARVLERHEAGQVKVIPILLRPCDWHTAPFAKFQVLPSNAIPITKWRNQNKAFQSITAELVRAIGTLQATAALAPPLTPQERDRALTEALAAARGIGDEGDRSAALAVLAPHLGPTERNRALREALEAARAIEDEESRSAALAALAPHLTPQERDRVLAEALAAARAIKYEGDRSAALAALAPHLTPQERDRALTEALAAARGIGDEGDRSAAPAALAPHLGPTERDRALHEALEAARAIGDERARSRTLAALAPHLGLGDSAAIEVAINRDFDAFNDKERDALLKAINELLNTSSDIKLSSIKKGSVRFTLQINAKQAEQLLWAIKAGELAKLDVVDAAINSQIRADNLCRRPTVFIGSSKEGLNIAEALQANMDEYCEATVWSQGAFGLGEGNLEALVRLKNEFDFAILVLTPDDLSISRGKRSHSPRDNVLFELGLFIGSLGRERTFAIYDRTAPMKLPSDLAGVSLITYIPHSTGNLQSALGGSCFRLKQAILGMEKIVR